MEHGQINTQNKWSVFGSIITMVTGWLAHVTKEDVLVWVSIVTGIVTLGYTIDKWVYMRKHRKLITKKAH